MKYAGLSILIILIILSTKVLATQQQGVVRLHAKPPEFRDVEEWINTKPLTFAKLKGQVVAVHFWTFG